MSRSADTAPTQQVALDPRSDAEALGALYGDATPARALLDTLWRDYVALNPQIGAVVRGLRARGERFDNDHIALRTFDRAAGERAGRDVGLDRLGAHWEALGYAPRGEYRFAAKGLRARHWEHPDPALPRVFISELLSERLPSACQQAIHGLLSQLPPTLAASSNLLTAGRPWTLDRATWQTLADASEYAGWLAAFGYRANHFTVDVRSLTTFADLRELNAWLTQSGFSLNTSGGEVKGSRDVYLEQSSTLAAPVDVSFTDGQERLPGCYVEFAERHPLPDGSLFSGFVADNADRIFESTDR